VSLNLLGKIMEVENSKAPKESEYKQQIIGQYPKLFEGLGELKGEYEIKLKELPEPFALNVPRKVPFPLLDKTKKEIERMLKIGVISQSRSTDILVCPHGSYTKTKWGCPSMC
jgi:hypothetical protein